ncbi:HU family DNA-binding protein [Arthrobacter caoxuetaonis]|uniref:HU family DNA-binding protein n=1 Tax=Arthrobacter caoxuetaonis TaxID=2886935 RepID=UPI001D1346B2|nr:HU family DNA-binding protein [Arthrobacter caoxuetaonis]MCC3283222.1 HU family DNA-binding protein [Arthrobacter caoxuetaonis]
MEKNVMVKNGDGGGRVNKREYVVRVARRAGVPIRVATDVYEAVIEEILDIVENGDRLTLTGFGKFYPQKHKGHRVQRINEEGKLEGTEDPETVDDYAVLKFSATRAVNRKIGSNPHHEPALGTDDKEDAS